MDDIGSRWRILHIFSPTDGSCIGFFEVFICLRKWTRSEKSITCRKWRWVGRTQNQVFLLIDERALRLSKFSPEEKNDMIPFRREYTYDRISKYFPSFFSMWCGYSPFYGQDCIEHEYPLFCPVREISLSPSDTEVIREFFQYVLQTRLRRWTVRYRKRQTHSGSGCVIGVLTEYNHFYPIERSHIKGTKNIFPFWKTPCTEIGSSHEWCQLLPVGLFKFSCESMLPRWIDSYGHTWSDEYSILYGDMRENQWKKHIYEK